MGGDVDYEHKTLVVVQRARAKVKGVGSLTGAALGGTTLPEALTVHPLGRPGMEVCETTVCRVVALGTHGQTLGVEKVELVSR